MIDRRALTALGLALAALCGVARADEPDQELAQLLATPVYAASKYAQDAADAPAAVTVLTQGDIRAFGWRTLGDVLNAARGVYLRYDRGYQYLGVRGLSRPGDYSSRLLLLIDGVRANDNIYDSVLVGREFPIDVAMIERVEFIPGPGSALYGANAVFGVINVVTRSAASLRGDNATMALDNDGGRKLMVSLSREAGRGRWLLAASAENRRGRDLYVPAYDAPETNHGWAQGLDGERDRKLFFRWTDGTWTLGASTSERSKQLPLAGYDAVFNDPAATMTDQLSLASLGWQRLDDNGLGWSAQATWGEYRYHDQARYEPDAYLDHYRNLGRWAQFELRRTLQPAAGHRLVAGIELLRNYRQSITDVVDAPVPVVAPEQSANDTRYGMFVHDEVTLAEPWRLGLGLRLDRRGQGGAQLTPRAALIWKPQPGWVLKALAGTAYREPNLYERLPALVGEPLIEGLRHELVRSRELAAQWQATPRWRLSGSVFDNRVTDLLELTSDPGTGGFIFHNAGDAHARGAEAEFEWLGESGWRLRTSGTWQRVTLSDGGWASNSPRWLGKAHATLPWPGLPLRLALELQAVGPRRTLAGATLPSHVVANAGITIDPPGQRWSVALHVYNLADTAYADPAGPEFRGDTIAQDGRRVALRWSLGF